MEQHNTIVCHHVSCKMYFIITIMWLFVCNHMPTYGGLEIIINSDHKWLFLYIMVIYSQQNSKHSGGHCQFSIRFNFHASVCSSLCDTWSSVDQDLLGDNLIVVILQNHPSATYLMVITFIFVTCLHSLTTVTHIKCICDSTNLMDIIVKVEISLMKNSHKILNPIPGLKSVQRWSHENANDILLLNIKWIISSVSTATHWQVVDSAWKSMLSFDWSGVGYTNSSCRNPCLLVARLNLVCPQSDHDWPLPCWIYFRKHHFAALRQCR